MTEKIKIKLEYISWSLAKTLCFLAIVTVFCIVFMGIINSYDNSLTTLSSSWKFYKIVSQNPNSPPLIEECTLNLTDYTINDKPICTIGYSKSKHDISFMEIPSENNTPLNYDGKLLEIQNKNILLGTWKTFDQFGFWYAIKE